MFAYVIANNFHGASAPSSAGNGGVILLVPSAPVSLLNNVAVTSAT